MNPFLPEEPTVLRLREMIPELGGRAWAAGALDVAQLLRQGPAVTPAVSVHFVGLYPEETGPSDTEEYWGRMPVRLTLRAVVTLFTRRLAPSLQLDELPSRSEAGPILGDILEAIRGWSPALGFSGWRIARPIEPKDSAQAGVFQMHFETQFIIGSDNGPY
jgi:hypothetical protein